MTTKERWLAAVNLEPVDRLPFWPKINGSYAPAQLPSFARMATEDLHSFIGSEPPIGVPTCVTTRSSSVDVKVQTSDGIEHTRISTPRGDLTSTRRYDSGSCSWHPTEFPIKKREDIDTMRWVIEQNEPVVDRETLDRAHRTHRDIGQDGVTLESVEKSALMRFVEYYAGVEQAHYFLADYPDEVVSLFDAIHASHRKRLDLVLEHSPADLLMMVENTSTTLISPEQYRRYCAPHIAEYARLARSAGRTLVLHMCGHLRAILPQLRDVGAHAFEAFTSPPVGNTTLSDGRSACADVCLIGGTNAALWLKPADTIIEHLKRDFSSLPDLRGIIPSSAGVMPPAASPEKIREVCSWIHRYTAASAA